MCSVFMPRLPCSLRSSLVPRCDPHSRSSSVFIRDLPPLLAGRRPSSSRCVNRSNSSPHPELSVRAKPPSSTLTVPGPAGVSRTQTRAPPHHQRHQQAGHHRQREHQHPHLGGVVGDLHVDERHRAVEADDGAVVEPGVLAGAQVDPRLLGEPLLFDERRVQGEQRLRPAGVQPGVALVDVDGHGRVVQRGKLDDSSVPSSCSVGANRPWMAIWFLRRSPGVGIACRRAGRTASRPTTAG